MYLFNLIISSLISMIASYIFTCNISKTDIKTILNPKKIIIFVVLTIAFLLNYKYSSNINRIIINSFILFLLNYILLKNSIKQSFFYILIFMISTSSLEIIIAVVATIIFNITALDYNSFKYSYVIFSILNSILLIFISKIKYFQNKITVLYKISSNIISFLFLIFLLIYILILSFNNIKILGNNIDFYINFFMTLFVLITSIIIFSNSNKRNKVEDKYNQMLEYVSEYENIINDQGKRNHEFNNQLMVLEGYLNNKKKLREYLNILIEEQKGGQNFRIKQLSLLPDGGLKGLVYYKLAKMEKNKIKTFLFVDESIKKKMKKLSLKDYNDITKMLGIYLDNAIDASIDSKDKTIEINMFSEEKEILIEILNSYGNNSDITKIGKSGYSSKGIGHGFGLSIVKDIVNKNKKIETFSSTENNMFKQTIIVY